MRFIFISLVPRSLLVRPLILTSARSRLAAVAMRAKAYGLSLHFYRWRNDLCGTVSAIRRQAAVGKLQIR